MVFQAYRGVADLTGPHGTKASAHQTIINLPHSRGLSLFVSYLYSIGSLRPGWCLSPSGVLYLNTCLSFFDVSSGKLSLRHGYTFTSDSMKSIGNSKWHGGESWTQSQAANTARPGARQRNCRYLQECWAGE